VAPKARSDEVRAIVEKLPLAGRTDHDAYRLVLRPWGSYRTISLGDRYQMKEIIIKPGASLSSQMHHHRAEHWVGRRHGSGDAGRGDAASSREPVHSYPLGTKHRLANPGRLTVRLIEVQSGSYLGEDDVIRFDDIYGRTR
jgi:mannose-6-phosphate isomerase-like protein (cupin superfamily)